MNELDIIRNHFLGFHNDFFEGFRRVSTYPPYNIKKKMKKVSLNSLLRGSLREI